MNDRSALSLLGSTSTCLFDPIAFSRKSDYCLSQPCHCIYYWHEFYWNL